MRWREIFEQLAKPMISPAQLAILLVIVGAVLIDTRCSRTAPQPIGIDSTAYFKNLESQNRLNNDLVLKLLHHNQLIKELYEQQDSMGRVIDALSGNALQGEIDRQFNSPGHAPKRGTPLRDTHRGRGAAGPPVEESGRDRNGGDRAERPAIVSTGYRPEPEGFNGLDTEPRWTGDAYTAPAVSAGYGAVPAEVARSQTGQRLAWWGLGTIPRRLNRPALIRERYRHYIRLILVADLCYPELAAAISMLETGGWNPAAAIMKGCNLFGFKRNSRKFSVVTNRFGYLIYPDESISLKDYKAFERQIIRKYGLDTAEKYRAHIESHYSGDGAYKRKLTLALRLVINEAAQL